MITQHLYQQIQVTRQQVAAVLSSIDSLDLAYQLLDAAQVIRRDEALAAAQEQAL